ncbi:hypothetical protein WQ57_01530 [Mesobacillus campisalis]|uniref:Uncharacterized protein n=1 Tax=Mesobacillus campisalis TaxID=1408103 RepID=A0A0M2SZJ0_9BACI|nr:hypothetical protein [Mesobacillus campisalis]KKK39979.1 hypothetical protein WQ57_01530 [Mesobacillus campisalis]
MKDLWTFGKLSKNDLNDTPHGILKMQADFFEKRVGDTLFIKLNTKRLKNSDIEYGLATSFEIVAPMLDGYTYTLFTLYSQPEHDYPVAIDRNIKDDEEFEDLDPETFDFVAKSEEDFLKNLQEIFSSPSTNSVIRNLYSKSYVSEKY